MKKLIAVAILGGLVWFNWDNEPYKVSPQFKRDVDQYFKDKHAAEALAERAADSKELVDSYMD